MPFHSVAQNLERPVEKSQTNFREKPQMCAVLQVAPAAAAAASSGAAAPAKGPLLRIGSQQSLGAFRGGSLPNVSAPEGAPKGAVPNKGKVNTHTSAFSVLSHPSFSVDFFAGLVMKHGVTVGAAGLWPSVGCRSYMSKGSTIQARRFVLVSFSKKCTEVRLRVIQFFKKLFCVRYAHMLQVPFLLQSK